MNSYNTYQKIKNTIEVLVKKLKLSKVSKKLWIYLIVNFIIKLLLVEKKNIILIIYYRLSKIIYSIAIIERILAKGLVMLFRDNIWKLYRLPKSIVSNKEL